MPRAIQPVALALLALFAAIGPVQANLPPSGHGIEPFRESVLPAARHDAYSEDELTAFVLAAARVSAAIQGWYARHGRPRTNAAGRALSERARAAILATGEIGVGEYRAMLQAVRRSEVLQTRVRAILARLRREGRLQSPRPQGTPSSSR